MSSNLPSGTVTFLFTDIEGSTKLAQEHPEAWETLRALHHSILEDAIESNKGFIFQIIGDAFCAAFHTTEDAIKAAVTSQVNLHAEDWGNAPVRVRMGIHAGKAHVQDNGQYIGYLTLSRVQRLMSAGYGEQTLLSSTTEQLARDNLPKGMTLRDLGECRLKDMRQPEHIFQLVVPDLPADFPPLHALETSPTNLPAQMTSFIGREKEMAEIKHALREHRLVTLTGSGGTGKTRLCLQVGADLLDQFYDGVWLVELAPLFDPAFVVHGVASQFGLKEEAGGSLETALKDYLREKHLVLILDNCEHLIAACAQFADTFLHACPNLKILASSREALGIAGETSYRVPSLSVPDPKHLPSIESLSQFEAVRLFIDRARMVQPSFGVTHQNAPAVAQICYRLDGIPLALELAASRVKALRVEDLEKRLDDRFRLLTGGSRTALPRQQTLRALIDWSYELLSEPERALLRRLSVFAGGWTLEAAEFVCADENPTPAPPSPIGQAAQGIDRDDILDFTAHLVDKSLIILDEPAEGTRYRILETIRQYAREKFFESGESENVRNRHLDFYLKLAEQAEPKLHTAEQLRWFNRLETEHDNLRAAQDWALASGQIETGIRLTWAMPWLWFMRGHWTEGRERTARLLTLLDAADETLGRALVLGVAGWLAAMQSDTTRAQLLVDECLAIVPLVSDQNKRTVASLLGWLAFAKYVSGDSAAARSITEQSLALARETDYLWVIADSLGMLGVLASDQQDYMAARKLLEESIAAFRTIGDEWACASYSHPLAHIQFVQGEYPAARSTFESIITIQRKLGNMFNLAHALGSFGNVERAERNYSKARVLMEECVEIFRTLGRRPAYQMWLADLARIEGDYARAAVLHRESLILYADAKRSDVIALSLELCAWLATAQEAGIRAARLFGAADALFEARGERMDPLERAEHEQNESTARTQLGAAEFATAWAEGRAMTMDQAIAYALESESIIRG